MSQSEGGCRFGRRKPEVSRFHKEGAEAGPYALLIFAQKAKRATARNRRVVLSRGRAADPNGRDEQWLGDQLSERALPCNPGDGILVV